jgi:hypothetical protein
VAVEPQTEVKGSCLLISSIYSMAMHEPRRQYVFHGVFIQSVWGSHNFVFREFGVLPSFLPVFSFFSKNNINRNVGKSLATVCACRTTRPEAGVRRAARGAHAVRLPLGGRSVEARPRPPRLRLPREMAAPRRDWAPQPATAESPLAITTKQPPADEELQGSWQDMPSSPELGGGASPGAVPSTGESHHTPHTPCSSSGRTQGGSPPSPSRSSSSRSPDRRRFVVQRPGMSRTHRSSPAVVTRGSGGSGSGSGSPQVMSPAQRMAENMRKLREEAADAEQCQRDSVKALAEAKETASRTWTEAEETALA